MTGRTLLALAALGALASACTDDAVPTATIGFRQPAAVAAFRGVTLEDPANVRPYFAVANAARNDLTLLDAADDTPVAAPLALRAVLLPVADRPALLAAAPLGDGRPDLLVAVSAGDSVLQVVSTWDAGNVVATEVGAGSPAVDLDDEVVALAAVPSAAGTARVAAALAGGRIAVVTWRRATGSDAIELLTPVPPATPALPFQPVALAALAEDPAIEGDRTEIYAATPDPIDGVQGVAAFDADDLLAPPRALGARGPTRLVAALSLRERDPASSATDASAFAAQPARRVYAVLDEAGCGPGERIDCGIVTLDPQKTTGGDAIPEDATGVMAYRAPIPIPGRPLALAVSGPPAEPPTTELVQYADTAMRLMGGTLEQATTGVGLVAGDDGNVYFLDLGRYKLATVGSALSDLDASASPPAYGADARRLWLQRLDTGAFAGNTAVNAATDEGAFLDVTAGYTRTQAFTVAYQGELPDLLSRRAEAGVGGDGQLWLAFQVTQPTGPTQVLKVFHPIFGVSAGADGDVVQIAAAGLAGIPACASLTAPLEARVDALLAPDAPYPGGALRLVHDGTGTPESGCFAALRALFPAGPSPALTATVRARGLLLTGATLGYLGRPALDQPYELRYADEEALAASCPLADWDGAFPVDAAYLTCGAAPCNEPATCEQLVLSRKARRFHHGYETCALETVAAARTSCVTVAGDPVLTDGPALAFRIGVQPETTGGDADPIRGMSLAIQANGGATALSYRAAGSPYLPTGAVAFDRSALDRAAGYRFLVSYSADLVLDVSPHVNPVQATVIR